MKEYATGLYLNDWLNRRMPAVKSLTRAFVPKHLRAAFAEKKFAATIASDDYDALFRNIYLRNWWGSRESTSGCGSELSRTTSVRAGLIDWFSMCSIATIFDAPCGDFNWMKEVVCKGNLSYRGGDIVPELVEENIKVSRGTDCEFLVFDILTDPLPNVDAWICRDTLFHFPNAEVTTVLDRFLSSDVRFFLTSHLERVTTHPDIAFGKYRPVNLCCAPFNWPRPLHLIFDGDATDPDRFLGVWENPNLNKRS